ncbi:MAG: putative sporulation protein YtxC [Caldicoprobacterales bacterium]|jgi:putative sporulation protein YtxC|nr:putative sporulation protein YtxC [Clostridiales bacterium]
MQLFSIGVEERDKDVREALYRKIQIMKPDGLDIEEKKAGNLLFFNYISNHDHDSDSAVKVREILHNYIADIISEVILEDLQSHMVEKIIQEEYFYFGREERNKILRDAMAIMWGGNPTVRSEVIRSRWRSRVWKRIMEHLESSNELVLEGFIRFRMKDFQYELEEAVDRAVDDLLIEKEYSEFIKLLRYFVEIQEPKVEEVHVMMGEDEKYTLLDSSLRVINNDLLEDLAREITDKEISHDDLLISSLITIAPKKIIIHQYDRIRNKELLNTINNVFNGKVIMSREGILPRQ